MVASPASRSCILPGPQAAEYGLMDVRCCTRHESGSLAAVKSIVLNLTAAMDKLSSGHSPPPAARNAPKMEVPLDRVVHTLWCNLAHVASGGLSTGEVSPAGQILYIDCAAQCRSLIYEHLERGVELVKQPEKFLAWTDDYIRWTLEAWGRSIAICCVPRPSDAWQVFSSSIIEQYYRNRIKCETLFLHIGGADMILYGSFGNNQIATLSQASEFIRASLDSLRSHYFLSHNRQRCIQDLAGLLARAGGRVLQQQSYVRLTHQMMSTRGLMRSSKSQDVEEILQVLAKRHRMLVLPWTGPGYRLVSQSLFFDQKRKHIFEMTTCDHSFWFGDDHVVALDPEEGSVDSAQPERWGIWRITVDSRNVFKRDRWASDLVQALGLQILDRHGFTTSSRLNEWLRRAVVALQSAALSVHHCIQYINLEGLEAECVPFTMELYNFFCLFALEVVLESSCFTALTAILVRLFSRTCSAWLSMCLRLLGQGLIPDLNCCLPILEYINRMLNATLPLEHFDTPAVLRSLQQLLKVVGKLLEGDRGDRNEIFLQQYVRKTIERCEAQWQPAARPHLQTQGIKQPVPIGEGANGIVYKCFDLAINRPVAIKEIRLREDAIPDAEKLEEVNYVRCLNHRHIVEFHGAVVGPQMLYLKMELCEGGSIAKLVKTNGRLDEGQFRRKALEILLGLSFLHGNHVVHGDLKPSNILINHFDSVKLADFGTSNHLAEWHNSNRVTNLGTVQYMAPEVIRGAAPCFESDVWSLGCTFFFMATGIAPWCCCEAPWNIIMKMAAGRMFDLGPLRESCLGPRGVALVESCLQVEQDRRPSVTKLLLSEYLYI